MGWKNVKEYYQIKHIVQVDSGKILIGSGFISDLLVIEFDGTVSKRYDDRSNDDLVRYQKEFDTDPELLHRMVTTPDVFEVSIPVFTYEYGTYHIVEKKCEELGWPNVTHDGEIMYANRFSPDKEIVVAWAKRDAFLGATYTRKGIIDSEEQLEKARSVLAKFESALTNLNAEYPNVRFEGDGE